MKASSARKVAEQYTSAQIAEAIEAITEREEEILAVDGEDMGERLTHLLVGQRIRTRVDAGEDLKSAFRAEFAQVRDTLAND